MAIILPHAVDGVKELERMLTPKKLGQWLASARTLDVQVQLPRFTIPRGTIRLNEPLKALGLFRLFDKKADMSGICAAPGELWIRQALEQALVEVNEEGAEAASVAVFEGKKGGGPDIVDFTADHPFLFVIRDGQTGCILFVGRLSDPS